MDTTQLIHIGTELVIVGGLTFYFNAQISRLKEDNARLHEELNKMQAALSAQSQALHSVIETMNSSGLTLQLQPQPPPRKQTRFQPQQQRPISRPQQQRPISRHSRSKIEVVDDEEESFSPEELDEELMETYSQLGLAESESTDNCEGETCSLKLSPSEDKNGEQPREKSSKKNRKK